MQVVRIRISFVLARVDLFQVASHTHTQTSRYKTYGAITLTAMVKEFIPHTG